MPHSTYCSSRYTWKFSTFEQLKIRFAFEEFDLKEQEEYLEIGDGTTYGEETMLALFTGADLPRNVTSISNSAWVNIRSVHGNMTSQTTMTVIAVRVPGDSRNKNEHDLCAS